MIILAYMKGGLSVDVRAVDICLAFFNECDCIVNVRMIDGMEQ